jgi:hypothetical protein
LCVAQLDVPLSDKNVLPFKTRSAAKAAKPSAKPAVKPVAVPAVDEADEAEDPDFVPPSESESGSEDEEEGLDDETALLSARLERFDSPVAAKNVITGPRTARAAAVAARAAIEAEVAQAVDVKEDEASDDEWVPGADGEEDEEDEEELIEAPRDAVVVVAAPLIVQVTATSKALAAPALAPARPVLIPEDCSRRAALYCSTSKLRAPCSAPAQALVKQHMAVVEQQPVVVEQQPVAVEQRQLSTTASQIASSELRRATPSFDPLTESSDRCGDYCALL